MKETGIKREMMKWTPTMDDAFILVMLNQHYEGNRVDGTFTTTAYNNMIKELKSKTDMDFTKAHLKNRIKTLKEHFNECYDIFKNGRLSGFAWNPTTKLWSAEPEVWDELIKDNPLAEKWKTKPLNNYESLEELFAKDRATGEGATTAKEKRKRWSNAENMQQVQSIDEIDELLSQNEIALEQFAATPIRLNEQPLNVEAQVQKKNGAQSGKKKKVSNDEEFEILKSALHNVADAIREGNFIIEKSRPRVYLEEEIFDELKAIGIESDDIDECYLYLTQNLDKTRAFFGCPLERRKNILLKMMAASKPV